MANYLARVELHKATYEDYEALHEAMSQRGFVRTIVANDGKNISYPLAPTWRKRKRQLLNRRTAQPRQLRLKRANHPG
jgi:hypothetical protein